MIKKKYVIVVLGIISVLLGSLLYANLVSAGKQEPSICRDSMKISLVSSDYIVEYQGVVVYEDSQFPFVFRPKEFFMNVTEISVFMIHCGRTTTFSMDLSLNGVMFVSLDIPSMDSPVTYHIHVEDANVYNALHSGINVMSFEGFGSVRIQELSIFIEYGYQAR